MRILKQYYKDKSRSFGFDLNTEVAYDPESPKQRRRLVIWFYWVKVSLTLTFGISK